MNHQAWAQNALAFISEKGLRDEFRDWCGGWPTPFDPERSNASLRHWLAAHSPISLSDARSACDAGQTLNPANTDDREFLLSVVAKLRYEMADAMLAERAKGGDA